jgi:hypothetical protein
MYAIRQAYIKGTKYIVSDIRAFAAMKEMARSTAVAYCLMIALYPSESSFCLIAVAAVRSAKGPTWTCNSLS